MIRMCAGAAARNIVASGSAMGCSSIEMPVFSAVISCDVTGLVGGAAADSNACWGCCKKHHGKCQCDGVFRHSTIC